MKTRQQWRDYLTREQAAGRLSIEDMAQMLTLRDERVALQDETIKALLPTRAQSTAPAWSGKVELQYFRSRGRYYSGGDYQTEFTDPKDLYKIFDEVRAKLAAGDYPGLSGNCPYFHVLVLVPGHPFEHPLLIPATEQEAE